MHRFRATLAVALAALALACGLAACANAGQVDEQSGSDTQITSTNAQNYLGLSTETGSAQAVASWSISGPDWSTQVTNTYDSTGNLTSQETVSTQPTTQTSQTVRYTYANHLLTTREATIDVGDMTSMIDVAYEAPSYETENENAELTYTGSGADDASGLSYVWESTYDLENHGLTLVKWIEQSTVTVPTNPGEESAEENPETTEIATSQTVDFDADGRATHLENTITGATLELDLAYSEDALTVSGDMGETWTLQVNDQGLITQAQNGDLTITIAYTELATPTNFNRALAKCSAGQAIVNALTLSLATGLLG